MPRTEPGRDPGMLERTRKLNVAFALSSIGLLLALSWMIWADYAREWKAYQITFNRLEVAQTRAAIAAAEGSIDADRWRALDAQVGEGRQQLDARRVEIAAIEDALRTLDTEWYAADQDYRFTKAKIDVARYENDVATNAGSDTRSTQARLDALLGQWEEQRLALEDVLARRQGARAKLAALRHTYDDAREALDDLLAERRRLQGRLAEITPPGFGSVQGVIAMLRNLPILEMANPSLKVQQIMPANLHDDVIFTGTQKVDRCTTCHLGIDKQVYADAPQPFTTHPQLELYLQEPHQIDRIGCTVCHQGRGRGTSFQKAAHTPSSPEQEEAWGRYTGSDEYHAMHHWDLPMLASGHVESQCVKCHQGVVEVPQAPRLNAGRLLVERYGCHGCHKIKGWEDLRKVGPSLARVAGKTDAEWIFRWIKEPRAFRPTRMPQVWDVRLDETPEQFARNDVEANAVTAYLVARSETPRYPAPAAGDLEAGRRTFESVGCLGCHRVGDDMRGIDGPLMASERTHGPNLAGTGSKVDAGWLFAWILDPQSYWHDTKMPRLRLTRQEAADVTAYLMSLTHEEFRARPRPEVDQELRDEIIGEYLRGQYTVAQAHEKLDAMSDEERTLALGEYTIRRYGCFGCHEIPGFEDANPIGTELTEQGSKLVERLDFGFEHERLAHTLPAWLEEKLLEPRVFDRNKRKPAPDLLRMPKFHLGDDEVDSIVTAILSFTKERVPEAAQKLLTADERYIEDGARLVRDNNCRGCHQIGESGGSLQAVIADQLERGGGDVLQAPALAPPLLYNAKSRIGEGARARTPWLHGFLRDPSNQIRPWLSVRMPSFDFDETEVNVITRYFAALDGVAYPFEPEPEPVDAATLATGKRLFDLWQCVRCHVVAGKLPQQDPANMAPDLALVSERLRASWLTQWLVDPQRILPGTRMPANFPEDPSENAYPEILGGERDAQIAAVRAYILTLGSRRPGS